MVLVREFPLKFPGEGGIRAVVDPNAGGLDDLASVVGVRTLPLSTGSNNLKYLIYLGVLANLLLAV
jgi:hypothetical protein